MTSVRNGVSDIDGGKNWLILMVSTYTLKLIVDNYLSYGILIDPWQIVIELLYFVIGKWWYTALVSACCFQQMLHMYLIEKSIIWKLISERTGMTLHALNSLFVGLASSVIFYVFKFNILAAKLWMLYIIFTFTKVWSFAYVNMLARRRQQKEKHANSDVTDKKYMEVVDYPHNVNLRNIVSYMVFTPPVEYQLNLKRTDKINIKLIPITILKLLLLLYVMIFIAYQYVIPELEKTSLYIFQGSYLSVISCVLNIVLPLNLLWLLYFCVFAFITYLPAHAEIVGMKGVPLQGEWWNAEDMKDYWPKWNIPMFVCFKNNIVKPLLQMGYSKATANIIVVLFSGLMHEISLSHIVRMYKGLAFICFLLQIPVSYLNTWVGKIYGKRYGNLFLWFCLCQSHTLLTVLMYYTYKRS